MNTMAMFWNLPLIVWIGMLILLGGIAAWVEIDNAAHDTSHATTLEEANKRRGH